LIEWRILALLLSEYKTGAFRSHESIDFAIYCFIRSKLLPTSNAIPLFFFFSLYEDEDDDLSFLFLSAVNSQYIFSFLVDASIIVFSF
jgi:hypothetical protein